ncbi:MAG: EAL and HDOD domain-containing protein [Trichloromonadaceae bacterium]
MEHFLARQPIHDRNGKIYGYELLFRSGLDNFFDYSDADRACSRVIANSFLLFSIEEMAGGARAFLNFTRHVLVHDFGSVLPRDYTVVEVLETVEPDAEVMAACRRLKAQGFVLALDDFIDRPEYAPLLDLVDILKIDFLISDVAARADYAARFLPRGIRLLAEKVETLEDYQMALDLGYHYFQGYYFSRPVIVSRKDIPTAKLPYLRILREVNASDIDFQRLAEAIQGEVATSYKLLRYINSAFFGLRKPVTSIMQALALLGEREFRKWISLLSLAELTTDKPTELLNLSLIRGKFCEMAGSLFGYGQRSEDLFLMGLFSLLDAILERPLGDVLDSIPMSADTRGALLGEPGTLHTLLQLATAMERGAWNELPALTAELQIAEDQLAPLYVAAVQWTNRTVIT